MISETDLGHVPCNDVVYVVPFGAILCDEVRPDTASAPLCVWTVERQRQNTLARVFSLAANCDAPADLVTEKAAGVTEND